MKELQRRDLAHIWHPCSQMKDYEDFPPIMIDRWEGSWLVDMEGNRYLDAVSSWWVNLFGHANPRLNRALREQAERLEHCIFCNFSHPRAIELAEEITRLAPEGLERVFFADNGSSAVEIALKMSFQYHQQWGNRKRQIFLSLSEGYHGETLGAQRGEEICGIILEPLVQGAAGMHMYSPVYLRKLRDLCSLEKIHFIADEIAVGFGRTGTMFACEQAGVNPDMMCLSKGITSRYLPLSLVLTTEDLYQAFYGEYTELKAFMDSHSYTGNALACALACETLKIFEEEKIILKNRSKSQFIRKLAKPLAQEHSFVGEFRQLGMITALELVNPETGESFPWQKRVGYQIYRRALQKGLLLRPLGNVLYFMPPYSTSEEDLAFMVHGAFQTLDEYFHAL